MKWKRGNFSYYGEIRFQKAFVAEKRGEDLPTVKWDNSERAGWSTKKKLELRIKGRWQEKGRWVKFAHGSQKKKNRKRGRGKKKEREKHSPKRRNPSLIYGRVLGGNYLINRHTQNWEGTGVFSRRVGRRLEWE